MIPYHQTNGATLYHGDCLEVLRHLPDGSVDAVVTDPPYSSGGAFRADRVNFTTDEKYTNQQFQGARPNFSGDNMDQRAWSSWCYEWLSACRRVSSPGAHLCCFTDWRQLPTLVDVIQWAGWVWRGVLVWDKTEAAKAPHIGYFGYQAEFVAWATNGKVGRRPNLANGGEGRMPGVFRQAVSASDKFHQTGKPTPVMEWLVRSCPPGGTVLDPFAGSGTTGVACKRKGRNCILVEREQAYCDIAVRRLSEVPSTMFDEVS